VAAGDAPPVSRFGIEPETPLEERIMADPAWIEGADWGRPMKGHPEGKVGHHIAEVIGNVDTYYGDDPRRERLRLVALVHDTFKHRVRWYLPWRSDHAKLARRFAERHTDDAGLLDVVELHDEGYRAWRSGRRTGRWRTAERRVRRLAERLGPDLALFRAFYRCDNETGSKDPDDRRWFESVVDRVG
jgi:hypothetical protein